MADPAKTVTVLEVVHANEMQEDLRRRLQESHRRDIGTMDSVRAGVLSMVVHENYDRAGQELKDYIAYKREYPSFQERVERHVQHCCDLIQAIRTKRNFPGLASLSLSKQQELHEKVIEHFEELKHILKYIEKVEREHKLNDVRSTVWVMQSLTYTVGIVIAVCLYLDLRSGMLSTAFTVAGYWLDDASTWVVNHIPFL